MYGNRIYILLLGGSLTVFPAVNADEAVQPPVTPEVVPAVENSSEIQQDDRSTPEKVIDTTKDSVKRGWREGKETSKEAWDANKHGSKETWDATKQGSKEAWEATKEVSKEAVETTKEAAKKGAEAVREGYHRAKDAVTGK